MVFGLISSFYYIVNSYNSMKYRRKHNDKSGDDFTAKDVTIVMPVYKEDPIVFEESVASASQQGSQVYVLGDDCDEPYKSIAEKHGCAFIRVSPHRGKRGILSYSMKIVKTPLVMFLDSDTVLDHGAVEDMIKYLEEDVGGVGTNISIFRNGHPVSYTSEFVERVREVIFKSMSRKSSVMVLDGRCALYRTNLVMPFLTSREFQDNTVMGKKSVLGDDRQLTSYIIRSGYRAVKDYDVYARTYQYSSFKKFFKQQIRWGRVGWTYFFKDIASGSARKAGPLYTFNLIYMYLLPIFTAVIGIMTLIYVLPHIHILFYGVIPSMRADPYLIHRIVRDHRVPLLFVARSFVDFLTSASAVIFGVSISTTMKGEKAKVFAYGSIGLLMMFVSTIYALFTFYKQDRWLTR
ncbi:membrane bound polysaccharide synthase related protein [Thermoplasma acidophilum]|uniref:Membrane bound polysaccharide synthase related protein n=2 Tax=Thermoplasma acidophilum TaxID=2303 RepID=Q9HJU0_THEAC|nr:membrane bound polysaccharide synthase related protein [Thermoplasma acidophilum]